MTQQHFDAVQKIPVTDAKELFHICSYCNHSPLSHMLRKTRLITCFIIRYFKWDQRGTMLPTHTKYSTEISRFGIFSFKLSITWALLLMRSPQFWFFFVFLMANFFTFELIFIGDIFFIYFIDYIHLYDAFYAIFMHESWNNDKHLKNRRQRFHFIAVILLL